MQNLMINRSHVYSASSIAGGIVATLCAERIKVSIYRQISEKKVSKCTYLYIDEFLLKIKWSGIHFCSVLI